MAKTLLDNAEYNLRNKALRVVATNLHQAMQQLFFTVEYKYHGFRSNEYDLRTHYLNIIRHFSIELRLLFDLNVKENRIFFNDIHSFSKKATNNHEFNVTERKLGCYINKLRVMQKIVEYIK